jgi:hypothetical protein
MRYFFAGYTTAPFVPGADRSVEAKFYKELARNPRIRGLEHPCLGGPGRCIDSWLLENLAPHWELLVTTLPAFMLGARENPSLGLASESEQHRAAALRLMKEINSMVHRVNAQLARKAVVAIEIQSAPTRRTLMGQSSSAAFTRSLTELALWDWDGARLVVEHCDAFLPGVRPQKGYLSLGEEIEAVLCSNARSEVARIGMCVNWGRSVVEGKSVDTPLTHIRRLRELKLLSGVMFSGATAVKGQYGPWLDLHAPFAPARGCDHFTAESLLTEDEVGRTLQVAGVSELDYLGIKLHEADSNATLDRRIGINNCALDIMDRCIRRMPASWF